MDFEFLKYLEQRKNEVINDSKILEEEKKELSLLNKELALGEDKKQKQMSAIMQEIRKKEPSKAALENHNKKLEIIVNSQKKIANKMDKIKSRVLTIKPSDIKESNKYYSSRLEDLKNVMEGKNKVDSLIKQFEQASKTLGNNKLDFNSKKTLADNCVKEATKLLAEFSMPSNINDSKLASSQSNFNETIANGLEYFVKESDKIDAVFQEKEEKRKNRTALLEQQMKTLENMKIDTDSLSGSEKSTDDLYSFVLETSFQLDGIADWIEKYYDSRIADATINDKDKKFFQRDKARFKAELEKHLAEEDEIIGQRSRKKPINKRPNNIPGNVIYLEEKLQKKEIEDISLEVFTIQSTMVEKVLELSENIRCWPNENLALKSLVKFSTIELPEIVNDNFLNELDKFSQKYIKKVKKELLNNPSNSNIEFTILAIAIAITYSSAKKIEKALFFIKERVIKKYGPILDNVKRKYPAIRTLHRHKVFKWRLNEGDEDNKTSITATEKTKNTIKKILNKDDYDCEENLDLLIYCLTKLLKKVNKLWPYVE